MRVLTILTTALPLGLGLVTVPAFADDIDCAAHVKTAQTAIDKVTDDMKGMETMPQDQLRSVHGLLDEAKKTLAGARHACDQPKGDADRARAIARAEAARGSAEAADILHWHYMKSGGSGMNMSGMSGMKKK
jgi:hypothetical protein